MTPKLAIGSILGEFHGASLGDARRVDRLNAIVKRVAQSPGRSFPNAVRSPSELEGLYRWFGSDAFDAEDVLAPHIQQTIGRCAARLVVRVLHDTTQFVYEGDRDELGIIEKNTRGYYAHVALAVGADETREPLGVLGLHRYVNTDTKKRRGLSSAEIAKLARATPRAEKTSHRWEFAAQQVESSLPASVVAVHVMDQDADDYVVFATLAAAGIRFVIRGSADRLLVGHKASIGDVLEAARPTLFRTVRLGRRKKTKSGSRYEARDERDAELSIRWSRLTLPRPSHAQTDVREVTLNVVQVLETNPPEGEQAVSWVLLTNQPVETLEDAAAVVDHYRARWLIEEYFKALKTGCNIEKRQLTEYEGLAKALAVFMPIAWEMLRLRHLGRRPQPPPAEAVMTPEELTVLRALLTEDRPKHVFPPTPSARDVLLAIAALGGHLKRNGEPGWQTIGLGYDDFKSALRVWRIARKTM